MRDFARVAQGGQKSRRKLRPDRALLGSFGQVPSVRARILKVCPPSRSWYAPAAAIACVLLGAVGVSRAHKLSAGRAVIAAIAGFVAQAIVRRLSLELWKNGDASHALKRLCQAGVFCMSLHGAHNVPYGKSKLNSQRIFCLSWNGSCVRSPVCVQSVEFVEG